jgi:flagellar biosynthesis protein FlhG
MTPRSSDRSARVIALASGKGGVGKTNIAVNLSLALSRMRRRSMLVDCDLGLANAAIMMGLQATDTIEDVVDGRLSLDEIVVDGPDTVFVIPGASASDSTPRLDGAARRRLGAAFRPHRRSLDYVIVDTATGAASDTLELVADSDMILLVVAPEPTAFMDAYATAKRLTLDHRASEISIVANLVENEAAGRDLFRRFRDVASRFLSTELRFMGSIPRDAHVHAAVMRKRCCIQAFPDAPASLALGRLARTIDFLDMPASEGGARFFGMEALLGAH